MFQMKVFQNSLTELKSDDFQTELFNEKCFTPKHLLKF